MGKNKKNNELRLERFFGNGIIIAVVLIVEDLLLYMLINYLFNIIVNLGLGTGNWSHPEYYIGIKNILPDFERIHKYHDIYGFICLVYGCFCLVFNIRQGYRMRASFSSKGFNLNQKGCARWTTTKEIKRQYSRIPEKDKVFPGYGGTIVSRIGKHLFIDTDLTNNLCIGITRSGKGEMYVIPSIDVYSRAEKKTSMVVLDPKTELYKTSKETLEERGYDVYLLSLVDPEHSMGFNPLNQVINLYEAGDYANAELLVQTFCYSIFNPDKPINGDTFWQDSPTSLFYNIYKGTCERLEKSVEDLLLNRVEDIHECIQHTVYENLDIIPSYLTLSEAEELMKADVKTPQQFRLQRYLRGVQEEYDYCIIDSSPSVSIINVNGLVAADEMYVPLRCDGGSLLGVAIIMNLFEAVSEYNAKLKMGGMFFTQWNGRKNVSKSVYELLSEMFADYILPVSISTSKNLEESSLVQIPLLAYDKGKNKCKATQDYLALTELILGKG